MSETNVEVRISRICWNNCNWEKPSGSEGKSTTIKSYEGKFGFGHEEWLFDTGKMIDGYHYGYLQPIAKGSKKYQGKAFNIDLYSMNRTTKENWWIGKIKKAEVISPEEANKIFLQYQKNNWFQEMEDQLKNVGVVCSLVENNPYGLFNIKYKPENLEITPKRFSEKDKISCTRYILLSPSNSNKPNKPRNPKWTTDELILALDLYFKVDPSHTNQNHPDIAALSELLNKLPIHADILTNQEFRNHNSVYMKLLNFRRLDPNHKGKGLKAGNKLEKVVWAEFADNKDKLVKTAQAIKDNYSQLSSIQSGVEDADADDEEFAEGKILTCAHKRRERNQRAINKKKEQVLNRTGKLACEGCGFDFYEFYGSIGKGFIECHHNKPVSELKPGDKTMLTDITVLCANCHRMIHRVKPWMSVKELRNLLL